MKCVKDSNIELERVNREKESMVIIIIIIIIILIIIILIIIVIKSYVSKQVNVNT